jgi:hypothetical protein
MLSFTASQKNSNGTFATTGSNIFKGDQTITGSLSVSGSTNIYGTTNVTGSVNVSGSTGTAITANVDTIVFTGSYAQSGSSTIAGNLTVTDTITAQKLIVQTVSSSVIYSSGSNKFGNDLSNTQVFTGSVDVTGSLTVKNVRPVILNLASGFTPVGIGTDYNILRVPEGKNISSTNYYITKVVLGVGITSSGTSTIRLEKSSGPHTSTLGFSLSSTASTFNVMSTDLSLLSGLGETSWTSFGSGYGTVATGDRVRLNFTAVDTAHSNFIVQMLLEEY